MQGGSYTQTDPTIGSNSNNPITKVNNQIFDSHNWHYSKQTIEVVVCECHPITAKHITRRSLATFSEFNSSNNVASVIVNGKYAGFQFNNKALSLGSSLVNSSRWWVTLDGPGGELYAQQARTNEWHALIGVRRWGVTHKGSNNSNTQHLFEIWTEAYEVGNNLNTPVVSFGRQQAFKMWNSYIEGVADMLVDKCGGLREHSAKIVADNFTGKSKIPFLN